MYDGVCLGVGATNEDVTNRRRLAASGAARVCVPRLRAVVSADGRVERPCDVRNATGLVTALLGMKQKHQEKHCKNWW